MIFGVKKRWTDNWENTVTKNMLEASRRLWIISQTWRRSPDRSIELNWLGISMCEEAASCWVSVLLRYFFEVIILQISKNTFQTWPEGSLTMISWTPFTLSHNWIQVKFNPWPGHKQTSSYTSHNEPLILATREVISPAHFDDTMPSAISFTYAGF